MSHVRTLDPEIHIRLIEGFPDLLTPERISQEALYRLVGKCPRCKHELQRQFDLRIAYEHDGLLPRALLTCHNCGFMKEPHTGVIINTGDPAKAHTEWETHTFE